jgi:hypothetical protein
MSFTWLDRPGRSSDRAPAPKSRGSEYMSAAIISTRVNRMTKLRLFMFCQLELRE